MLIQPRTSWLLRTLLLLAALAGLQSVQAQSMDQQWMDYSMRRHAQRLLTDDAYAHRWQTLNHAASIGQQHPAPHKRADSEDVRQVPVVFHVVWQQHPPTSDEQLLSQIRVLNEDYQQLPGTPGQSAGANMQVGFFLANQDPDGNCHSGIVRMQHPAALHHLEEPPPAGAYGEEALKALSRWPTDRYLNIWVVDGFVDDDILGYATLPAEDSLLDGIVIARDYVGWQSNQTDEFNLGRTTTHEVGHWLGLYHPFDGGCTGMTAATCAHQGDYVCDTSPMISPSYDCGDGTRNSCVNTPNTPDPHRNYMDYLPDACMDRFTAGQVTRVRTLMAETRAHIYSAANLTAAGWGGPCVTTQRQPLQSPQSAPAYQLRPQPDGWQLSATAGTLPAHTIIRLRDGMGRLLHTHQLGSAAAHYLLKAEHLPAGLYLVEVQAPAAPVMWLRAWWLANR